MRVAFSVSICDHKIEHYIFLDLNNRLQQCKQVLCNSGHLAPAAYGFSMRAHPGERPGGGVRCEARCGDVLLADSALVVVTVEENSIFVPDCKAAAKVGQVFRRMQLCKAIFEFQEHSFSYCLEVKVTPSTACFPTAAYVETLEEIIESSSTPRRSSVTLPSDASLSSAVELDYTELLLDLI